VPKINFEHSSKAHFEPLGPRQIGAQSRLRHGPSSDNPAEESKSLRKPGRLARVDEKNRRASRETQAAALRRRKHCGVMPS